MNNSYEEDPHYVNLGPQQSIKQTMLITVEYIISDIKKKPRSFKIGLFTIYLVVTFLALIQSATQLSPLIFLQLAETTTGDADLIFTPVPAENRTQNSGTQFGPPNRTQLEEQSRQFNGFSLINTTEIGETLKKMPNIFGQSPRWLLIGDLMNNKPDVVKTITRGVRSFVLIIDSQNEISIGLGRRLETNIITNDEILVSRSSLRGLNATIGDTLELNIDIVSLLSTYGPQSSNTSGSSDQSAEQFFEVVFDDFVNKPLEEAFGPGFVDEKRNVTELRTFADALVEQADLLESDPALKDLAKEQVENQIKQLNVSDQVEDQLLNFTDTLFERNLSADSRQIQDFVYRLDDDQLYSIRDFEDAFSEILAESLDFNIPLRVKESIGSPRGKWADGLGNVVVMDYKNATTIISQQFLNRFEEVINDARENDTTIIGAVAALIPIEDVRRLVEDSADIANFSDFALSTNLVFENRVATYSDEESVKHAIISMSNRFFKDVGYDYPVSAQTPLGQSLQQFFLLKNFIDNLIVSATFLLLMLSVLLIYSLMIGDVEEKTYEFGMLRALGFKKQWLVLLLTFQALTFALPGLFLGLLTCYILNALVAMFIFDSSYLVSTYDVAPSAIGLAFGLGILIPLGSNILPILRALSKTLRDSLDLYHRTVNDILVTVIKLEKMGVSLEQTSSALLLILMGFVSYYMIPMAFIFSNIKLALAIINIILIIMIIGFTLLVNLLERPFERLILYLSLQVTKLLKYDDFNLKPVILKNLEGHYSRNWKTTLMYTIALAFLIFAGAGFSLQTEVITDILQSTLGADMVVMVARADAFGLDEYQIRQYMDQTQQRYPDLIEDFAFTTYLLQNFPQVPTRNVWISTLSRFPWRRIRIGAVDRSYLRSVMQQYYLPNEYDNEIYWSKLKTGQKDGVEGLYSREANIDLETDSDFKDILATTKARKSFYDDLNFTKPGFRSQIDREINILIPEGYKYEAAINVKTPSLLYMNGYTYRIRVRHMATKVPGFAFSSYRAVTNFGEAIISCEDMQYLLNDYYGGNISNGSIPNPIVKQFFEQLPKNLSYGLPKDGMMIKFAKETNLQERTDFSNGLRNYFKNEQTLLFDVIQLRKDAQDTFYFITLFYVIVAIVAMTLSFFLILVSFVSNVKDNSWEFGVLRAVGLSKAQITRVYIYEAFSLITASGLLGTIVGLVVAITLTLQILMFTELPFKFVFPTEIFLLTFLGGGVTAILGSYLAVLEIRDKSISTILKGLL